jgi:hypothetical protein
MRLIVGVGNGLARRSSDLQAKLHGDTQFRYRLSRNPKTLMPRNTNISKARYYEPAAVEHRPKVVRTYLRNLSSVIGRSRTRFPVA